MTTSFSPELIQEMVKAYDLCTRLLGRTVKEEDVAQHIINTTAFGVDNGLEMASMTMSYFKFRNKLMKRG